VSLHFLFLLLVRRKFTEGGCSSAFCILIFLRILCGFIYPRQSVVNFLCLFVANPVLSFTFWFCTFHFKLLALLCPLSAKRLTLYAKWDPHFRQSNFLIRYSILLLHNSTLSVRYWIFSFLFLSTASAARLAGRLTGILKIDTFLSLIVGRTNGKSPMEQN